MAPSLLLPHCPPTLPSPKAATASPGRFLPAAVAAALGERWHRHPGGLARARSRWGTLAPDPRLGRVVVMEERVSHCAGDVGTWGHGGTGGTGAFATGLGTGMRPVPPTSGVVAVCP